MAAEYVAPERNLDGFNCPLCGAFAHQEWTEALANYGGGFSGLNPALAISCCSRCSKMAFWIQDEIVYPATVTAPPPHDDLAEPALTSYLEARQISGASPRSAAALLRLCLEQLVHLLGATNDNLNSAVGELVSLGLPTRIQQAMDTVRLIGNEAVHPGEIDLNDDPTVALALFDLVNIVVETMVTQPRMVEELYGRLPPSKLEAVERRDGQPSM